MTGISWLSKAFGLLVIDEIEEASQVAKSVLAKNPASEFAAFIAGQAAFHRNDFDDARSCIGGFRPETAVDPLLKGLIHALSARGEPASGASGAKAATA